MRMRTVVSFLLVILLTVPTFAQMDGTRGNAEVTIKSTRIKINYGRPSLRGRDMIAMATTGTVWRLGMDDATEIETTGNLVIAGKELKAGKYSLWAKKTGADSWILAFHPSTGIWGDPAMTSGYVAELPLKAAKTARSSEQLTISLAESAGNASVKIHWGTTELSGTFGVK